MKTNGMILEQLVTRWEDRREIQNLMGRYTYDLLLKKEKDIFDTYWCRRAADPCLGFNSGYFKGYDAIKGYYEALHQRNLLRTALIMEDFAAKGKSARELYGCGVLEHKPLGNQIIEIAGDGKTAKGFWYVVGKEDEYGISGPLSYWTFGMYGVDFIWEDDQWRIWHLVYAEDIRCLCGESWAAPPKERPVNELYRPIAEFDLPKPTAPTQVHASYTSERPFCKTLPLPEEYETFAETFSYGV